MPYTRQELQRMLSDGVDARDVPLTYAQLRQIERILLKIDDRIQDAMPAKHQVSSHDYIVKAAPTCTRK